ncbi:MAG TPA: hypothetical protein VGV35_09215 [Bryobacteraceae bacterium]|nr:hypothetical protein [Bryobacteraceae bacterium]
MRTSNRSLLVLVLILSAVFLYGLWRLYDLRFSAGDIYPAYSSLRADPLGAMAFYESVGQLPDFTVTRNFLPVPSMPKGTCTVFFLGEDPFTFRVSPEERLKEYEVLASGGARVVFAMAPVRRIDEPKKSDTPKEQPEPTSMEKRWGVTLAQMTRPASESPEEILSRPKLTALYFRYKRQRLSKVELPFGAGVVVLLANSYLMSNEALAGDRDTKLLAEALGDNSRIIFDEHHLGLSEEGGVATLARKYRLQGMAAALLALLALFVWKNSSSFLPPRTEHREEESVAAKDVGSGLANLLRRNVSNKTLLATCLEQWEKSQHGGRHYSKSRIARVRAAIDRAEDPAETYRRVAGILAERSNQ